MSVTTHILHQDIQQVTEDSIRIRATCKIHTDHHCRQQQGTKLYASSFLNE